MPQLRIPMVRHNLRKRCCMHSKGLLSMNLPLKVVDISPLHAAAEDAHGEAEVMEVRQPQQHVCA